MRYLFTERPAFGGFRFYLRELTRIDAKPGSVRMIAFSEQLQATARSVRSIIPLIGLLAMSLYFLIDDFVSRGWLLGGCIGLGVGSIVAAAVTATPWTARLARNPRRFASALILTALLIGVSWACIFHSAMVVGHPEFVVFAMAIQAALIFFGALICVDLPVVCLAFSGPVFLKFAADLLNAPHIPIITEAALIVLAWYLVKTVVDQSQRTVQLHMKSEELRETQQAEAQLRDREVSRELGAERERTARKDQATKERRAALLRLANQFDGSIIDTSDRVGTAVEELSASAIALVEIANATSEDAHHMRERSLASTSSVQHVAVAAEQLDQAISEVAEQIQANLGHITEVGDAARASEASMTLLVQRAGGIGEIVTAISDVARQTNLLALNATIEAARAGEAGRGFAIVAQEVKALASQTARMTEDIAARLGEIDRFVTGAASALDKAGTELKQLEERGTMIAAATDEQRAASQEIRRHSVRAAQESERVQASIKRVADAADQARTHSAGVRGIADNLADRSRNLREATEGFLGELRAS